MTNEEVNNQIVAWSGRFGGSIIPALVCLGAKRHDTENILQETLNKAALELREGRAPNDPDKVGAWLWVIAWRLFLDSKRKQKRDPMAAAISMSGMVDATAKDSSPIELKLDINEALESLTERQRIVVVWYFLRGYSVAEIAATLQITKAGVQGLLKRAMSNLYDRLIAWADPNRT